MVGISNSPTKPSRRDQHPGGGEDAGAIAVGEVAADRSHDHEADRQRQHVDAGPQRRILEGIAVQGQPDALQPDDDHQIQAAACQCGQETGDIARAEHPDLEQLQPEHGFRYMLLDEDERHKRQRLRRSDRSAQRDSPTHGRVPIWLDPIGGADQKGGQAEGEKNIAGDVEMLVFADRGCLVQGQVGPDGAADGKWHADQEYIAPVDGCQDATRQQADERAARAGDHVDTHGQAALVGREGVRQDGSGVGHQESASDRLDQPEDDDLHGGAVPGAVHQIEHDRADRKDGKTEVVERTRPNMSEMRPKVTRRVAVTTR